MSKKLPAETDLEELPCNHYDYGSVCISAFLQHLIYNRVAKSESLKTQENICGSMKVKNVVFDYDQQSEIHDCYTHHDFAGIKTFIDTVVFHFQDCFFLEI